MSLKDLNQHMWTWYIMIVYDISWSTNRYLNFETMPCLRDKLETTTHPYKMSSRIEVLKRS